VILFKTSIATVRDGLVASASVTREMYNAIVSVHRIPRETKMTIEERLAVLERDVATLKRQSDSGKAEDWLKKVAGSMKDEPDFAEVLRLGQEIRRANTGDS
jgi:hypothetical protein